jgi:hypothetical protein
MPTLRQCSEEDACAHAFVKVRCAGIVVKIDVALGVKQQAAGGSVGEIKITGCSPLVGN